MADLARTRISLDEFQALPESLDHIELIAGELVMSPAPKYVHQRVILNAATLLQQNRSGGTVVLSPSDVYLDAENVLQPDVFWVSGVDSLCRLGDDGYWHGAPDLVLEVLSPSTAQRDHGTKFALYEQHGTREYWLIDPVSEFVQVFRRTGDALTRFGVFGREESFPAGVLPDVAVQVSALFAS